MRLPDVNILVGAHREEAALHDELNAWLEGALAGPEPLALADTVLCSFVRITTHPRIYKTPTPRTTAMAFATRLRLAPGVVPISPGPRHWDLFRALCDSADARGDIVQDAWLAALVIEAGCELVTLDRDFARFEGLRWSRPLG